MEAVAVSADGVNIHYELHGQGECALIFVHGWCCNRSYWQGQIRHFANRYTVIAIDLAGHGDSAQDRAHWTIPAFGKDVVAVIEQSGLKEFILIGHSMGGPVIVEAARQTPSRIIGLIGADTLLNPERMRTPEVIATQLAPLQANFSQATRSMVLAEMFVATSDRLMAESIADQMASAPPNVGIESMRGLLSHDDELRAGLRSLQAPIVLINADYHPTDFEATRRFGIKVELMSGVGHFVMAEDAASFNKLLEATIDYMIEQKEIQKEI